MSDTKEIPLSRGLVALVDAADFDWLTMCFGKWHAVKGPKTFYAGTNVKLPDGGYKIRKMHAIILGRSYVDHINHNGLDNRRENLRPATRSQNSANGTRRSDNKSGYRGVSWATRDKEWVAAIGYQGKVLRLGKFDTPEEAAAAYDAAAIDLFGEFAQPNFAASR